LELVRFTLLRLSAAIVGSEYHGLRLAKAQPIGGWRVIKFALTTPPTNPSAGQATFCAL
jgi:hypothetical protein